MAPLASIFGEAAGAEDAAGAGVGTEAGAEIDVSAASSGIFFVYMKFACPCGQLSVSNKILHFLHHRAYSTLRSQHDTTGNVHKQCGHTCDAIAQQHRTTPHASGL